MSSSGILCSVYPMGSGTLFDLGHAKNSSQRQDSYHNNFYLIIVHACTGHPVAILGVLVWLVPPGSIPGDFPTSACSHSVCFMQQSHSKRANSCLRDLDIALALV